MSLYSSPIARLLLPFALGILSAKALSISFFDYYVASFLVLFILIIPFYIWLYKSKVVFALGLNLFLFIAGFYNYQLETQNNKVSAESLQKKTFLLKVIEHQNRTNSKVIFCNAIAHLDNNKNWTPIKFKIALSTKSLEHFTINDWLIASFKPQVFISSILKSQFDYGRYLSQKGFDYNAYTNDLFVFRKNKSIYPYFENLRLKSQLILDSSSIDAKNIGLVKAMLLGDKSFLSNNQKERFANAGIMHVLAVSGLHLGIIYLIFDKILNLFSSIKNWKKVKSLLLIILLWSFAFYSGFGLSVQRSAIMFSCFCLANVFGRRNSSINGISLAAFIMLIMSPKSIFDVGFLLSFSAVTGLVLIGPIFQENLSKLPKILAYFLGLVIVSMIAQISTLPLIIANFHQFPTWFLLFNIFIIPFCFIIVFLSIGLIFFGLCFSSTLGIDVLLDGIITLLMEGIKFVDLLPLKLIDGVYWSDSSVYILVICILFFFSFLLLKKRILLISSLFSIVAIVLSENYYLQQKAEQKLLLIYKGSQAIYFLNTIGYNSNLLVTGEANDFEIERLQEECKYYQSRIYKIERKPTAKDWEANLLELDNFLFSPLNAESEGLSLADFWYCQYEKCHKKRDISNHLIAIQNWFYCKKEYYLSLQMKGAILSSPKAIYIDLD